ncbi:MAG: hypothetical protein LLF97_04645 [Planctomycetaceae bacterium]|nr:hypothetical protein [Planctomycetaceae bacterium]
MPTFDPNSSQPYGDAAFLDRQLRLRELIPRGPVGLIFLLTTVAAALALFEASYGWTLHRGATVPSLDLSAKGSLGGWFLSLMLLSATAASLVIYSVRRHRLDDRHGRFRIWLWAAVISFLLAANEAVHLGGTIRDLIGVFHGVTLLDDRSIWWPLLYGVLTITVGSRMAFDMRGCRASGVLLLLAAVAYSFAVAGRWGWIAIQPNDANVLLRSGCELSGHWAFWASLVVFARHVTMDAEGLLPRPPASDPDEDTADDQKPVNTWNLFHRSHDASPPTAPSGIGSTVQRKLTKAEKKALKERLLRDRAARESR